MLKINFLSLFGSTLKSFIKCYSVTILLELFMPVRADLQDKYTQPYRPTIKFPLSPRRCTGVEEQRAGQKDAGWKSRRAGHTGTSVCVWEGGAHVVFS